MRDGYSSPAPVAMDEGILCRWAFTRSSSQVSGLKTLIGPQDESQKSKRVGFDAKRICSLLKARFAVTT
jgi:hypothetical protein